MKILPTVAVISTLLLTCAQIANAREIQNGKKTLFGCTWSVAVEYEGGQATNACSAYKSCGPGAPRTVLYNGTTSNGGSSCNFSNVTINHGQKDGVLVEQMQYEHEFSPASL